MELRYLVLPVRGPIPFRTVDVPSWMTYFW
jgi:hypothetical protein